VAVTLDDVRHMAALARLGLSDDRATALVAELNTILAHMDVLSQVDTSHIDSARESVAGLPMRPDVGPPIALERDREDFAPKMRDGFFVVPRLSTHEEPESAS
jgi:aspartyl-tRNA(Asn)/glutamyl-tRNA(Gln) amidotransferase subunit C